MLLDAWRLAFGTLTALPTPPPKLVDRQRSGVAVVIAPLAVLPLGVLVGLVVYVGNELDRPPLVTALLAVGALVLGTRAFHLDGLSDTVDGLAASYDRERSLAVMKTGTSGPAGVVAVVLVLGLQVAGLASLLVTEHPVRAAVLAGACVCVSRAALALCCLRGVASARPDGLGSTYTQTVARPVALVVWIAGGAVLAGLAHYAGTDWWRGALAAGVAVVVVALLVARAVRRFGGVTGDVFGAAVELALAALLVTLA